MKNYFVLALAFLVTLTSPPASAIVLKVEPDTHAPLVYFALMSQRGSTSDPAGKAGLMNLMGEMLLRGTTQMSKERFNEELDFMGAVLHEKTRADAIVLEGAVLKSEFIRFQALVIEMLQRPAFLDTELKNLKNEVSSEILEQLGDDDALANRVFLKALFPVHPYGRPKDGTLSSLQEVTTTDLRQAYRSVFRPQDLTLVLGGDITPLEADGMKLQLEKVLAGHTEASALPAVAAPEMIQATRIVLIDKPGRTQAKIRVGTQGVGVHAPDATAFSLFNHAFGGGYFSAYLMKEIRGKRGWSYGAYSQEIQAKNPHAWFLMYAPKIQDVPPSVDFINLLIRDLVKPGLLTDEITFAKENLINNSAFVANTPTKRMQNTLNEILFSLPEGYYSKNADRIEKTSIEDAQLAMSHFFKSRKMVWVILGPAAELLQPLQEKLGVKEIEIQVIPYSKVE